MWLLTPEEKVEWAGESRQDLVAIQQKRSWPVMVNEVRIWGKMYLTKTAGQARLTQAEANTSDDDPNDLLD